MIFNSKESYIKLTLLAILLSTFLISCRQNNHNTIEETATKIEEVTVRIEGKVKGSGLIIKRDDNVYYVLTSKHVVGFKPSKLDPIKPIPNDPEEQEIGTNPETVPYKIITFDNQVYEIENYDNDVQKDNKIDLAIVKFTSDKNYKIATLSTTIKPEEDVSIYGFKACSSETANKQESNQGKILKIDPASAKKDEGYGVYYSNATITGMSGSPVFNDKGQVIAIHGKPGKPKIETVVLADCPEQLDSQKFGNNWGISMDTFAQSSLASGLELKFSK